MTASQLTWKKEQQTAVRSLHVLIRNTTSYTLVRTSCAVVHGIWSCVPPEKIFPNSEVEFGSQSFGPLNGTEGNCYYGVQNSEKGNLVIKWCNPFIGTRSCTAEGPNAIFTITPTVKLNTFMEATFVVEAKVRRMLGSVPLTTEVEPPDWKNVVSSAGRSAIITVDNKTRYRLIRTDIQIWSGVFGLLPPEAIAPNSVGNFAAYSKSVVTGIWGRVDYSIVGSNGDTVSFLFYNPFVGISSYEVRSTNPIIELNSTITRNNNAVVTFSIWTKEKKSVTKGHKASFKILSCNTTLYETRDSALPTRTKPLKEIFKCIEKDLLCLQGVYSNKARQLFIRKLQANFPYNAQSSSYTSGTEQTVLGDGLFIFSRFPILKSFDHPFTNGVGVDTSRSKGILGAKLDMSSISPRKILYVFVTHLQSNSSSVGDLSVIQHVREEQLKICRQFIHRCVIKENRNTTDFTDFGVLLCGDLALIAETLMLPISDLDEPLPTVIKLDDEVNIFEEKKTPEEIIEDLAIKINEGQIVIDFATNTITMLTSLGLPNDIHIGKLRQKITIPRQSLMILIAMVWEVVEEEIYSYLKSLSTKPEETKKAYINSLFIYFNLLFCCHNLSHVLIYADDEESEIDSFWKKCRNSVISKYSGLFGKEIETLIIRDKILLCKYQLIRIFQERTGLRLKGSCKERILGNNHNSISTDDVDLINYDGLEVANVNLWDRYKELFSSNSVILDEIQRDYQNSLIKTPEYCNALSTLMCTDVYRTKHPSIAGFTVLGKVNNLVSKKEWAHRVDYIMVWDCLGEEHSKIKLLPLECNYIKVRPLGDTPENQLSTHFPLEAEFSILL